MRPESVQFDRHSLCKVHPSQLHVEISTHLVLGKVW